METGNDGISSEEHFDHLNISRGSHIYLELFSFVLIPSRGLSNKKLIFAVAGVGSTPSYNEMLRGRQEAIFAVLADGTRGGAKNNDRNKKGNLLYYYSSTVCTAPTVLNLNS
jgi:hypothetical protein